MNKESNKLIVFEDKRIRRIWFNDEWKNRGVEDKKDFAILTNETQGNFQFSVC